MEQERLTKEQILNATANKYFVIGGRIYGKKMFSKMTAELIEYKQIEEELGVDLITLFKALISGVFIIDDDYKIKHICSLKLFRIKQGYYILENKQWSIDFRKYKKHCMYGWALTKEELEK